MFLHRYVVRREQVDKASNRIATKNREEELGKTEEKMERRHHE